MTIAYWIAAAAIAAGSSAATPPKGVEMEIAPGPTIDETTTTDEIAIDRDLRDRMTVNVSVGGKGPYQFLVDTGSERTVISRELAHRLRLEGGRDAVLHSVVGAQDVRTVVIPHLKVSNNVISVIDAPALAASNIGADGMLGIDSLQSKRVLFDFKANTMSITPASEPVERLDGQTIVVRASLRQGRLIFTKAKVNGQRVTVIVDTGSQTTIGNLALQRSLHWGNLWVSPGPATIESVTGEKLDARVARVGRLDLNGLHVDDLTIAFADAHIFKQLGLGKEPALLLGMNAMRAFDRISIDFAAKKVRFVLPGTSFRETYRLASAGGM